MVRKLVIVREQHTKIFFLCRHAQFMIIDKVLEMPVTVSNVHYLTFINIKFHESCFGPAEEFVRGFLQCSSIFGIISLKTAYRSPANWLPPTIILLNNYWLVMVKDAKVKDAEEIYHHSQDKKNYKNHEKLPYYCLILGMYKMRNCNAESFRISYVGKNSTFHIPQ